MMLWLQRILCNSFGHRWIYVALHERICDHCQRQEYLNGKTEWRPVSERPVAPSA